MKKLVLLSLPLLLLVTACNQSHIDRQDTEPVTPAETEKKVSDLKEEEYKTFYKYYYEKLNTFKTLKLVTKGETVSTVLFVEIHQSIDVTVLKDDYSYMKNESHSDMVNTSHEVYYHEDKALYRDNEETDYHLIDMKPDYLNKYGTYPFDNAIEGYIVNEETITSISLNKDTENYTFKFTLDVSKAAENVKIQMKQFGGLDDYPVFSDIKLAVTVKNDFTPVSIDVDTNYNAKKFLETPCHQTYNVTYSNLNEAVEIPNLNEITPLFNKQR